MEGLPREIIQFLIDDKFICPKCHENFKEENIFGFGIGKDVKTEQKNFMFIDYICNKCKETLKIRIKEMDALDMAFYILQEYGEEGVLDIEEDDGEEEYFIQKQKEEKPQRQKKTEEPKPRSKITRKELKEINRIMKNIHTGEDMLRALGMSSHEIDTYDLTKKNKSS